MARMCPDVNVCPLEGNSKSPANNEEPSRPNSPARGPTHVGIKYPLHHSGEVMTSPMVMPPLLPPA